MPKLLRNQLSSAEAELPPSQSGVLNGSMVQVIDLPPYAIIGKSNYRSLPARILATKNIRNFAHFWPRSSGHGAARCFPFQIVEVLELSCNTFVAARNAEPLFVAIVNAKDEPLALIPLMIEDGGHVRILRFLDGGMSEYNAPVLFPPVRDWNAGTVRMIWQAMRKIRPRFDRAIFEKMPNYVGDLPNPWRYLATSQYSQLGHAITLSGNWDDFSASLPHRRSMKKAADRLCKLGTQVFDIATTPEQYDEYVEALIRQKSRQYCETWGYDGLDRPGYRSFLRGARGLVYPSGPVHLFALKVDSTIVATCWGYLARQRFYGVMKAYDYEWHRYSPGRILFNEIMRWCFAKGLGWFDCGIGEADDKTEYCDVENKLYQFNIPITIKARAIEIIPRSCRNLIEKPMKLIRRYSDGSEQA